MKRKIGTLLLLLCATFNGFAQEKTQKHVVAKGETITQIAKKYQTTANEIFLLNPTAVNGINENQVLQIPNNATAVIQHEVLPQETVYGISKKYNIAIDQLYLYNPGLQENGLKVGQLLNLTKVRVKSAVAPKALYKEVEVKDKETIYAIAVQNQTAVSKLYELNPELEKEGLKKGQFIKIPLESTQAVVKSAEIVDSKIETVKQTTAKSVLVQPKETIYGIAKKYNVTQEQLLQWNPSLKDGLREGIKIYIENPANSKQLVETPKVQDIISPRKVKEVRELTLLLPFNIKDDTFDNKSLLNKRLNSDVFLNMTLDFYAGALMAIESAKEKNLPIHVNVVDSKENNRALNIENLKKEVDFSSTEVVIGPFFQKNVDAFSEAFKNQPLLIVSPLSTEVGEPYANQVHSMPNGVMMKNTMMEFLRSKNGNVLAVLNPKSSSSQAFFTSNFSEVKQINTSENGAITSAAIEAQFIAGKTNFVVLDSNSLKTAIDLVSILKKLQKKYDVQLVVLEKSDVLDSTEINTQDLADLKFTFPSVTNESENKKEKKFEEAFKKKYGVNPSRFAVRGFDVTQDVLTRMLQSDDPAENIFGYGSEQIENKFMYVNANGGIYNSAIYILYYDKDLTIKEAE